MKYWAPNMNKFIINLWILTAYLESKFTNHPGFQFLKHLHFCSSNIDFAKFVPLLLAVAETHFYRWK